MPQFKIVFSIFFVILITASPFSTAVEEGFIEPTAIATAKEQRQQQVKTGWTSEVAIERRVAALAELALITTDTIEDLERIDRLLTRFQELLSGNKNDPELTAAMGSLYSYKASLFTDNLAKLSILSRKGTRFMDKAVKDGPKHLGARLQRGVACANMPPFVKRAHFAVEDLTIVRDQINEDYGVEFKNFVEYFLALATLRNGQESAARKLWKTASLRGDNLWATKSKEALAKL